MERVKIELIRRLELLTKTELNDENFMTAISSKVIPVTVYTMSFHKSRVVRVISDHQKRTKRRKCVGNACWEDNQVTKGFI